MCSPTALAAISPISISIVPPVQFPPEEYAVTGARVSLIFGDHRYLYGVDIAAIGNITQNGFGGIGISGLFNMTKGTTNALLQLAGGANINTNKTNIFGVQAAAVNNNVATSTVAGLQVGVFNKSSFTTIFGLQAGIINKAQDVVGFQIGLANWTTNLHGIQIGLINFYDKGLLNMSPILNIGFN